MPAVGELLADRYRIESFIRQGTVGPVYLCHDVVMDRDVAVVVLAAALATEDPELWQRTRRRMRLEARAAGRLTHQNLVTAYSFDSDAVGNLCLVLGHGSEPTLAERLKAGPLAAGQALDITLDVARAIQALDNQGIVHRDIKPDHILIDAQGTARVTGLGLAQLREDILGTQDDVGRPGTPAYMSPEQATSSAALDQRSDLYTLGLVLYEMLAGRLYVSGRLPLSQVAPETPSSLVAIVEHLLQSDPRERYQSAQDLIEDLEQVRDQGIAGQVRLVLGQRSTRTFLGALVIIALLLWSVSAWTMSQRPDTVIAAALPGTLYSPWYLLKRRCQRLWPARAVLSCYKRSPTLRSRPCWRSLRSRPRRRLISMSLMRTFPRRFLPGKHSTGPLTCRAMWTGWCCWSRQVKAI